MAKSNPDFLAVIHNIPITKQ